MKIKLLFTALIGAFFVMSCAIPFEVTTDETTMVIPSGGSYPVFVPNPTPNAINEDARDSRITIESMSLNYNADSNPPTVITIYASTSEMAGPGDGTELGSFNPSTSQTGSIDAEAIISMINNGAEAIYFGVNVSADPGADLNVDLSFTISGTASPF